MLPLKIMSWNVEHFNGNGGQDRNNRQARQNRVNKVVDLLVDELPDIFGLIEVEGALVYDQMTAKMPGYTFHITQGVQSQEILIGVKSSLTAFFTQKDEFKRNNPYLRPGALLTVRDNDIHIPILFTHLKSMPSPEGFGLRDSMFERVFKLQKKLDKAAQSLSGDDDSKANFIVLGDMNTMGMDYYRNENDISMAREIEVLTKKLRRRKMTVLKKSHPNTFFNGSTSPYPPSNLDHVFAANHLNFQVISDDVLVKVGGWAEKTTISQKDAWVKKYSDHAPIIFTLNSI